MKLYQIDGVQGVFVHLETVDEQTALVSVCGKIGGHTTGLRQHTSTFYELMHNNLTICSKSMFVRIYSTNDVISTKDCQLQFEKGYE